MTAKVLCTYGATYAGGIQRVLTDGLPHLSRCVGIDLAFGDLYEREDLKELFRTRGLKVVDVGLPRPPYTSLRNGFSRHVDQFRAFPDYCRIAHRLRRTVRAMDVIYVHTYKELVLAAASAVPIVWHCHGLEAIPPLARRMAGLCHRVIAISESVAEALRSIGVRGDKIVTVENAIDVGRVRADGAVAPVTPLPVRGAAPVVLLPAASIRANKGIHLLLQAAATVPGTDIWIAGDMSDPVGDEYRRRLIDLSRAPALSGRIHFLGFRADIYSVMLTADAICIPSVCREGFGLVAAEAMALGKPVIVSNRGALPEVVQHRETGIVIDPDIPQELVSALRSLTSDKQYLQDLGAKAAMAAEKRFSYVRWADGVAQVLRQACQG